MVSFWLVVGVGVARLAQIHVVERGPGDRRGGDADAGGIERREQSRAARWRRYPPAPAGCGPPARSRGAVPSSPPSAAWTWPRRNGLGKLHLDGVAAQLGFQPLRRALDHDLPVVDDGDALRQVVGLFQVVRRQHDGQPVLARQPGDLAPHVGPRLRVEAGRRLVQKQHLRLVDQAHRDVELALHAAGERARDALARVREVEPLQQR